MSVLPECPGVRLCHSDLCTCKAEVLRGARKLLAIGPRMDALRNVMHYMGIDERARPPMQDCRVYPAYDRHSLIRSTMGHQFDPESDAFLYLGLPAGIRDHEEFFRIMRPFGIITSFTYGWTTPLDPGEWKRAASLH